ncbi:hypothetical protein XENOCAPTIV_020545, partial [Xenoophorus captivus]
AALRLSPEEVPALPATVAGETSGYRLLLMEPSSNRFFPTHTQDSYVSDCLFPEKTSKLATCDMKPAVATLECTLCGPGHLAEHSGAGIPEMFFRTTAIKVCYSHVTDRREKNERRSGQHVFFRGLRT